MVSVLWKYQKAKTPYKWLMDSEETPAKVKQKLEAVYATLNPAKLKRTIDSKLKKLAGVYQVKQSYVTENDALEQPLKVTFSIYPTAPVKCPVLIT